MELVELAVGKEAELGARTAVVDRAEAEAAVALGVTAAATVTAEGATVVGHLPSLVTWEAATPTHTTQCTTIGRAVTRGPCIHVWHKYMSHR